MSQLACGNLAEAMQVSAMKAAKMAAPMCEECRERGGEPGEQVLRQFQAVFWQELSFPTSALPLIRPSGTFSP